MIKPLQLKLIYENGLLQSRYYLKTDKIILKKRNNENQTYFKQAIFHFILKFVNSDKRT